MLHYYDGPSALAKLERLYTALFLGPVLDPSERASALAELNYVMDTIHVLDRRSNHGPREEMPSRSL